jgi:hypothetical protein
MKTLRQAKCSMWFANTLLWNASVNSTAPVCPLAVSVTTNVSLALEPT